MGRTRGPKIDVEYEKWFAHRNDPPTDTEILEDLVSAVVCGLALSREEDPDAFAEEPYEEVVFQLSSAAIESGLSVPDVVEACERGEMILRKVGLFNSPAEAN